MAVGLRCMSLMALLVLLTGTPGVRAAKFRIRYATVSSQRYLFLRDVATYYGMQYSHRTSAKHVYLVSRYSRLVFNVDKRTTTLNGTAVHLGHPIRKWKGNPVISDADFRLLLDPILRRSSLPRSTVRAIVIDPGHGGKDPGTTGTKLKKREKDLVLKLAKKLQAELTGKGYKVYLTRTGDSALSLAQRSAIAARKKADVFVSLHANYVGTPSVRGVESFRLCPKGTPSSYGNRTNGSTRKGNACDRRNSRLAYEVQRSLVGATKAEDRGVKQASFCVLRDTTCPAVLVEVGFMSNAKDERLLNSARHQAKIAAGIAAGIQRYRQAIEHRP